MKKSLWRKVFAQQIAVFFVSGLFVLGGFLTNTQSASALTAADMSATQCQALATGADCLSASSCDGSYTILAPSKSCDVNWSPYAGKCCVKTASFTCPGTCKSSIDTSAGEWNHQGGSQACAFKSPATPLCAMQSIGTGTPTPGATSTNVGTGTPTPGATSTNVGTGTPTPGTGVTTGGATSVSFANPLQFNTVQDVLGSLLLTLRGIIVILAIIFIVIGAVLYITSAGDSKRIETAKSAITASMIGLALGIAAPSFLKEISTILGWNAAPVEVSGALSLTAILTNVLTFLTGIVGILAIIMLVIGALMYLSAAGDEDRIDDGKKIVKFSIIGIIIAFAALIIVKQIAGFFL